MLYKLYIQRFKEGVLTNYELFKDMAKIYRDNGVIILGNWINKKNPNETILMTVYKNEEHYQEFVKKMKNNPQYLERQMFLGEIRESFESRDLDLNKRSHIQASDSELMDYIADVKSSLEDYT